MILFLVCLVLTLIGIVVSAAGPVRCLFWLSVIEILLRYPRRRDPRRGDAVTVVRPGHAFESQEVKVSADLGEGGYWVEQIVAPRWRIGARVAANDVVLVKHSWLRRKGGNMKQVRFCTDCREETEEGVCRRCGHALCADCAEEHEELPGLCMVCREIVMVARLHRPVVAMACDGPVAHPIAKPKKRERFVLWGRKAEKV